MPADPSSNGPDPVPDPLSRRPVDDLTWAEQCELVLAASARILHAQSETASNAPIGAVYAAAERHALEGISLMKTALELERDVEFGAAELERARRERGK